MTAFPAECCICLDCGAVLKEEEARYYETQCEECVRAWGDSISSWRAGRQDDELDTLFGAPQPLRH